MRGISYREKLARRGRTERVAVVYPFTWANPFFAFPPIAAEYVQAGVVETGREARLFDLRFESDLREPLRDADLVCLYGYFEDCAIFARWDRHAIPEVLEQVPADTPVVAGGTGFSEPAEVFAVHPKIDVVLRGNPDATVMELLEADELGRVESIAFRDRNAPGGYVETPRAPRPLRDDVYPRRHLRNPSYRGSALRTKLSPRSGERAARRLTRPGSADAAEAFAAKRRTRSYPPNRRACSDT